MNRGATISRDRWHRFDLVRAVLSGCQCFRCRGGNVRERAGFVLWVLCNPSVAAIDIDDPTERRGWGFTDKWGFGEMRFVNTNPCRSTDPKLAAMPSEDILLINDSYLRKHAREAAIIVCAWGTHADQKLAERAYRNIRSVARYDSIFSFGLTKHKGRPKHPLYLPADSRLYPYEGHR